MAEQMIGIIGGSGLYNIEGIKDIKTVSIDTPFGKPSDSYTVGSLEGRKVAFRPNTAKVIRSYLQNSILEPIFTG